MVKIHCDTTSLRQRATIKQRSELLPGDQAKKLYTELNILMKVQKYYLNPFISAEDVALKLNVHRNVISYVVSNYSGMHFRDFLNEFRLLEVERLFQNTRNKSSITIESLITESTGFFSMSTYYRAKRKRERRSSST